MTVERLKAFAQAWSEKNIDTVMDFFTEDCRYSASVVQKSKETAYGKKEVREKVLALIAFDDSITSEVNNLYVDGYFGFWEWEYKTVKNGTVKGCDVFTFQDDLIQIKNAYRKIMT